jgi:hypothetical protein
MPGKVNPVIPEVVRQVCFQIIGADVAISMAREASELELNMAEPIIAFNLPLRTPGRPGRTPQIQARQHQGESPVDASRHRIFLVFIIRFPFGGLLTACSFAADQVVHKNAQCDDCALKDKPAARRDAHDACKQKHG